MQQKSVRTVEYSYRGEPVPEMNAEPEKVMSEVLDEIKKSAQQEEIYEPVTSRNAQRQEARLMKESIIERIVYFIGLNIGVIVYFCDTNIGV